jgi:hypothetical protein
MLLKPGDTNPGGMEPVGKLLSLAVIMGIMGMGGGAGIEPPPSHAVSSTEKETIRQRLI